MSRITVAAIAISFMVMVATLVLGIAQRDHEIANLKERNAALSRLCGPDPNASEVQP